MVKGFKIIISSLLLMSMVMPTMSVGAMPLWQRGQQPMMGREGNKQIIGINIDRMYKICGMCKGLYKLLEKFEPDLDKIVVDKLKKSVVNIYNKITGQLKKMNWLIWKE